MSGSGVQVSAPQIERAARGTTLDIALSFLPAKSGDFEFTIYRRRLHEDEEAVPGTRNLPKDGGDKTLSEINRYEVSLQPKAGMDQDRISAWANIGLTDDVLHQALVARVSQADLQPFVEVPNGKFTRTVDFVLRRHGDAREVMSLRAYGLLAAHRFGFLCQFALRVPRDSTLSDRRRLELSLTHKNGRINEDFYLDQNQKLEAFLTAFFAEISTLKLHDGTQVSLEPKLSVLPAFTLARRTYVFGGGREGKNQFFGLREFGPYQAAPDTNRLVFVFTGPDREKSQQLYRALRGDTYSTFPGMERLFGTAIGRHNVSGIELSDWSNVELRRTCAALKSQFPDEHVIPIGVIPMSKYVSDEETQAYFAIKHACLSEGLSSQFVNRKRMEDRIVSPGVV